jgi:hypothetical protein
MLCEGRAFSEASETLLSVCDTPFLAPSALSSFPIVRTAFLSPIARTNTAVSTTRCS